MANRQGGFSMLELMAALAIMVILSLMAVPSYMDKIVREQIQAALPLADMAKKPIADWWSATLSFPRDNATLLLPTPDKIVSNYIDKLTVEDGAIHLSFGNRAHGAIAGKTLTLRPAVMADAPTVPITWVCGMAEAPGKMTVYGGNQTSVPPQFLPLDCRALKRD